MSEQGWVCIDCARPDKLCPTERSMRAERDALRAELDQCKAERDADRAYALEMRAAYLKADEMVLAQRGDLFDRAREVNDLRIQLAAVTAERKCADCADMVTEGARCYSCWSHATAEDGDHLSRASRRMCDTVLNQRDAERQRVRDRDATIDALRALLAEASKKLDPDKFHSSQAYYDLHKRITEALS